ACACDRFCTLGRSRRWIRRRDSAGSVGPRGRFYSTKRRAGLAAGPLTNAGERSARLEPRVPWIQRYDLQDAETRCSDRTYISRSTSSPVTLMRSPTCDGSFAWFDVSYRSTDADPFFRNPLFQLRLVGTASPDVSFSRYAASSRARQPVIVTGSDFALAAASAAVGGSAFDPAVAMAAES